MRTMGKVLLSGLAVLSSVGAVGSAALYAQFSSGLKGLNNVGGATVGIQTLDYRDRGGGVDGDYGINDAFSQQREFGSFDLPGEYGAGFKPDQSIGDAGVGDVGVDGAVEMVQ